MTSEGQTNAERGARMHDQVEHFLVEWVSQEDAQEAWQDPVKVNVFRSLVAGMDFAGLERRRIAPDGGMLNEARGMLNE